MESARCLCSCVWNKARWIYVIYGESVPSQLQETQFMGNLSRNQRFFGG